MKISTTSLLTAGAAMLLANRALAGSYSIDILIDPYHVGFVDSWLFDINDQGQATGYVIQRSGNSAVRNSVIYSNGNIQVLTGMALS